MQRLDKKELAALRKEVRAEIKEIKSDIKASEKANEFSRKVDRLYDRLEGNELLLDAIDMAVQEMSGQRLSDADWDELVSAFRDAVEFADSNKASFDSRDVLDRVLVSNANESVIKESDFYLRDRSVRNESTDSGILPWDSSYSKEKFLSDFHHYKRAFSSNRGTLEDRLSIQEEEDIEFLIKYLKGMIKKLESIEVVGKDHLRSDLLNFIEDLRDLI